jgi:hypothetical protein
MSDEFVFLKFALRIILMRLSLISYLSLFLTFRVVFGFCLKRNLFYDKGN